MKNLNPAEWKFEFQQRGDHPLLMADFWCKALSFYYPKEINLDIQGLDYLMTSKNKGYYKYGKRELVLEKFKDKLEKDPNYIQYIFDSTKKRVEEFAIWMDSGEKDWDIFTEKFLALIPWFYIPWYITEFNIFSDKVENGLKKYQNQIKEITDIHNAAMILMFPDKEMEFQREQVMFYDLVEQKKNGKDIDLQEYIKEFSWMKTLLVPTEPLNEKELIERISVAIKERSDETYKLQRERKKKDKEIALKIENLISADRKLLEDIQNAKYLAWLLTWSVEISIKSFAKGIPLYKNIAASIKLPYSDWMYLTIPEVRDSLKNSKSIVSDIEIENRKRAYVFFLVDKKTELIAGNEAESFIEELENVEDLTEHNGLKEILGKPAYQGKTKGRVRICYTASDSNLIEYGDILVTAMTSPDYVPAMKRAGAIVTNEGGLLCHAAIISRELGIPCIIGTKIATKVLKDGDLVEVDAEKGIVRKIS